MTLSGLPRNDGLSTTGMQPNRTNGLFPGLAATVKIALGHICFKIACIPVCRQRLRQIAPALLSIQCHLTHIDGINQLPQSSIYAVCPSKFSLVNGIALHNRQMYFCYANLKKLL